MLKTRLRLEDKREMALRREDTILWKQKETEIVQLRRTGGFSTRATRSKSKKGVRKWHCVRDWSLRDGYGSLA